MPNYSRTTDSYSPFYTPAGVKWLVLVNSAVFVVYFFCLQFDVARGFFQLLPLRPVYVVETFFIWQPFTYLFLHADFGHIIFNMLSLWFFGKDLEITWGMRRFFQFYFLCGVGAAFCVIVASYLFGDKGSSTVGASGAIYGLLMAFAILFPDRTVYYFFFPIKAKYLVLISGAVAFMMSFAGSSSGVSHIAHLGGMIFGYAYLKTQYRNSVDILGALRQAYKDWKLQRARKKFQVYMSKNRSGNDRWNN
jgi:membrane associated rhomboid family serine protease